MSFRLALVGALLAHLAVAQVPDSTRRVQGTSVTGVVYDSVAHMPLAGAIVQIVSADPLTIFGASTSSDSTGRFAFTDVPAGRFSIGFYHPMIDSLGVALAPRPLIVRGTRPVRADLAIPSPSVIGEAICSTPERPGFTSVLLGVVRDARTRAPVAGATVVGEWREVILGGNRVVHEQPRLTVTTIESGWFALCGVPGPGMMGLTASRGADSTDLIELEVPKDGFLRRELYLGAARVALANNGAERVDTLAPPSVRVHVGDGRLRGHVTAVASGKVLPGATVRVSDGPGARANEYGEWAIVNAPTGTRMLEVRAVGYYPVQMAVDVVDGVAPIHVKLSTLRAILDTVRIIATFRDLPQRSGFIERRRSGMGRYYSPEDVLRFNPIVTSDLFRNMTSVRIARDTSGNELLVMRGAFEPECNPDVYLNGMFLSSIGPEDLDTMVRPKDIVGIEVYTPGTVPPQFQFGLRGCGSIVFWTK